MVGDIEHIIFIESLEAGERKTGLELYNDCIVRYIGYHKSKILHNFHEAITKSELIDILNYYVFSSPYLNGGILIHLEMHGSEDKSGLILANGELITWMELVDLFRQININAENKLYITMATCYGRYLYKGISIDKKSPYSCYISTSTTTNPSEIIEQFSLLFENLIKTGNLVDSYLELDRHGTKFYYKDSKMTFEIAFRRVAFRMRNDPTIRQNIIDQAIEVIELEGYSMPSEDEFDKIVGKAIHDSYLNMQKMFIF